MNPEHRSSRIRVDGSGLIHVIADGMIGAVGVGEGRMLAVLVLDTGNRPDIDELVRIHGVTPEGGDAGCRWALPDREADPVVLRVAFFKPMTVHFDIAFDLPRQAALVDLIVATKGMYIQPGRPGDGFAKNFDNPRLQAEVLAEMPSERWESILRSRVAADFRREGVPRARAKVLAAEQIDNWRELMAFRISGS